MSHILFADDMLVFYQGRKQSAKPVDVLLEKLKVYTSYILVRLQTQVRNC